MRGKVLRFTQKAYIRRITPAYAGKSCASHFVKCSQRDHPRLCGEKGSNGCSFPVLIGSPPPMRGKVIDTLSGKFVIRITPAYAGKRHLMRCAVCGAVDHPRLCGEKSALTAETIAGAGSPPPMRGKATDGRCTG